MRKVRLSRIDSTDVLPRDLVEPEGKSRWHLNRMSAALHGMRTSRPLPEEPGAVEVLDTWTKGAAASSTRVVYTDPAQADAALRWVYPETYPDLLRPGSHSSLRIDARSESMTQALWIELQTIGIGWVHLPSGPREAVLQRARVFRTDGDGGAVEAAEVLHRWIDPRDGVVARVGGPAAAGGLARIEAREVTVVDEVITGSGPLKLFREQLYFPPRTQLSHAWIKQEVCVDGSDDGLACTDDAGCGGARAKCGTFISSLTTDGHVTVGDLVGASSWNFTPSVDDCTPASIDCKESLQGNVELTIDETCNLDPNDPDPGTGITCGYQGSGKLLGRQDSAPSSPTDWRTMNQVTELETLPTEEVIWLRAGAQNEGQPGGFGTGETRFCHDPDFDAAPRPEVALYRFPHEDAPGDGFYLQAGDSWSTTFSCNQVLFSGGPCGGTGLFGEQRAAGQGSHAACTHPGTQSGSVVKEGVVTLPSGHTFNAALIRVVADFCVYNDCNCGAFLCGIVDEVRTDTLTWQVPQMGTVVLTLSKQLAPDLTSYTKVALADVRIGQFPPVSISAGTVTENSIQISWNPGNDTHRIDNPSGYNVYWDTVSGASTDGAYANSTTVSTTPTTIPGLDPGTTYYFTVTTNTTYANPSNPGVSTTYESLRYPSIVSGDPSFVYPVEVQATTSCGDSYVPTSEVTGLSVDKDGTDVEICWDPVYLTEACIEGFQVLGAGSPESDTNFAPIVDVGLTNCWTGSTTDGYFLVVAKGSGGNGPWGHFED